MGVCRFWKRAGYVPLYLRQTTSELTGEHTCVMVKGLNGSSQGQEWLGEFAKGELLFTLESGEELTETQTSEDVSYPCYHSSSESLEA